MSSDLTVGDVATVEGQPVTVSLDPVMVNNANVINADLVASNGVIHVIDTVLIPDGCYPKAMKTHPYQMKTQPKQTRRPLNQMKTQQKTRRQLKLYQKRTQKWRMRHQRSHPATPKQLTQRYSL